MTIQEIATESQMSPRDVRAVVRAMQMLAHGITEDEILARYIGVPSNEWREIEGDPGYWGCAAHSEGQSCCLDIEGVT